MGLKNCIQACDQCKEKRRKCLKVIEKCMYCIKKNLECTYYKQNIKRGKAKAILEKHVELEEQGQPGVNNSTKFINFNSTNIHLLYENSEMETTEEDLEPCMLLDPNHVDNSNPMVLPINYELNHLPFHNQQQCPMEMNDNNNSNDDNNLVYQPNNQLYDQNHPDVYYYGSGFSFYTHYNPPQ